MRCLYAKYWRFIKWHILEILGIEFTGTWLLLASWSNSFPSPAVEDNFIQILKAESEPQHLFPNSTFLLSGLIRRYFWVTGRSTAQKWFNHAGGTPVSGRSQVVGVKWWMSQSCSQSAQVTPGLTQRASLYSWGRRVRERIRTKTREAWSKVLSSRWLGQLGTQAHSRINASSQKGIPCGIHFNLGCLLSHWQGWNLQD